MHWPEIQLSLLVKGFFTQTISIVAGASNFSRDTIFGLGAAISLGAE
jgi:hypothetical protein